jgi:2-octaprenyl-6-methoxyphenol hydroxylase
MRVPALGYVVAAGNLARNLDSLCRKLAIPFHQNSPVTAQSLPAAQLTIWAEGRIDADEVRSRDYAQHAVICNVQSSVPHQQRAWERFTEDGPLALLPCDSDSGIAVVLTCPSAAVAELTGLADNEFIDLLEERIGKRLRFVSASARQSFPLALRYREQVTGIRQVWIGNAAQTLHPVAGQGFNLSLRDIHTLADCLCDAVDPGDSALLDRYCARRRIDRLATIGFTDSLVRIFGVGNPLVRHVRGSALIALDLIPPARAFLARRMMFGARGG